VRGCVLKVELEEQTEIVIRLPGGVRQVLSARQKILVARADIMAIQTTILGRVVVEVRAGQMALVQTQVAASQGLVGQPQSRVVVEVVPTTATQVWMGRVRIVVGILIPVALVATIAITLAAVQLEMPVAAPHKMEVMAAMAVVAVVLLLLQMEDREAPILFGRRQAMVQRPVLVVARAEVVAIKRHRAAMVVRKEQMPMEAVARAVAGLFLAAALLVLVQVERKASSS
jgi:hypothetical protein